jgi:hypothetical protein
MTIWPVDAEVSQAYGSNPTASLAADSWLIQTFGNYQPNGHTGVDFPVEVGTPVRAAAGGVVRHVGWYSGSYADNPYWIAPSFAGFCLVIDHGAFVGVYAHLSGSPVTVGQQVSEGQVVAQSGNTGGSTGPHLHFEVLPDGWDFNNGMYGRVNPAAYITGGAALAPQSSIVTPKPAPVETEEFTVAEAAKIIAILTENQARITAARDAANLAVRIASENQRRITEVREVVKQIATKTGTAVDYAKIDQIVDSSLAAGVDVKITVNGKEAA